MNVAVIGTSIKENEKRVAIHPQQIKTIPKNIRKSLFFEKGYGIPFGVTDEEIATLTGNTPIDRMFLLHNFGAIVMPKPIEDDFKAMRNGTLVWGWTHSVQSKAITQIAINKKLTLISWENMYYQGSRDRMHIFEKNNEMAGYCGVQHALMVRGIDGNFGIPRKIAVLSLGSVSRGAICALMGHGFHDITVYTQRPTHLVSDKMHGVQYKQIVKDKTGAFSVENPGQASRPMIDELASADIIVNGILQDPNDPITFIHDEDIVKFTKECLIIDISCDKGMGFSFAKPTDLSHPSRKYGNIVYYSVDHTPTLLWDSASWEISNSIIPFLESFTKQSANAVLDGATDIKKGVILNKDILAFQNRSAISPYDQINAKIKKVQLQINSLGLYPARQKAATQSLTTIH